MKKKIAAAIAVILLILLLPIPQHLKDGGTVEYRAVLYKISMVHSLNNLESEKQYSEGTIVEILGFEVYNNVK